MARARTIAGIPVAALAAVALSAGIAWVVAGLLADRAHAARLPDVPDLAAVAPPVRDAVIDADRLARREPGSATAVGALGTSYHASLLPAQAIAAYTVAESLDGREWRWTYQRALLLEERGDAPGARTALARVTVLAPGFGPAWFRLAEQAFKEGRLDDAATAYEHAKAAPVTPALTPGGTLRVTSPLSAYADMGLARIARERGDLASAHRLLQTLVGSYPSFGPPRTMLRQVELAGARLAAVTADAGFDAPYVPPADPLLDAIVADSRHSDLLLKHAGQATRAGDAAWREYLVRRAFTFNPKDLNVLMEMAAMLQATGKPGDALEYLHQHESLAPNDHHNLVEQGRSLADLGRLPEAEAVLRRAVRVRDAAAEYNLATVLDQQGRWEEARAGYQRALAIDPFHTRAMNNLGVGLDRRGQSLAAMPFFERAIDIAPGNAEFHVNYGSALIQLRRLDDAVRALTTAVGLDPRSTNAHNNLGIAAAQQGDLPRAQAEFERALRLSPQHENARRNLDRVTAMLGNARPR